MKRASILTFAILFVMSNIFAQKTGTFTDSRDGETYKTIKIENQTWMSENLSYAYDKGCWTYDDNSENLNKYGYLYDWETSNKVCPNGWYLPSVEEFVKMLDLYGGVKSESAYNALLPDGASGFSALLG